MSEEEEALINELGGTTCFETTVVNSRAEVSFRALRARRAAEPHFLIARSGVGPVNAALTTALIVASQPQIQGIVLLGVGGALVPSLRIGELVISSVVLQHDSFCSLDSGDLRMFPGTLILTREDSATHVAHAPADPSLRDWLKKASPDARVGAILSGNEFVGTYERKRAIAALHGEALLVDMEAAGVAQVAKRLQIPFAVAKTVADRLQPDGSIESDFRACLSAAAKNAAAVLRQLISA